MNLVFSKITRKSSDKSNKNEKIENLSSMLKNNCFKYNLVKSSEDEFSFLIGPKQTCAGSRDMPEIPGFGYPGPEPKIQSREIPVPSQISGSGPRML